MPSTHVGLIILLVLAATTIATAEDMDGVDDELYQPAVFDHRQEDMNPDLPRSDEMERKLSDLLMDKRMTHFFRSTKRKGPNWSVVKRRMPAQRQINGEAVSQYSRIIKKGQQDEPSQYSRIFKKRFLSRPINDNVGWRSI